ncbi:MAG: hypothetical protein EA411_05665 [Saprospirales bacterium]|nr:MAG: hypothetical protein EA411_05665 [Saprospirales bacterium]
MAKTKALFAGVFIFTVFCLPFGASAQEVFRHSDGTLTIRFEDGTEREVVPSDSILFSSAFEEITVLEKQKQPIGEPMPVYVPEDYYASLQVRMKENRLRDLRIQLEELRNKKDKLGEELEFARENPGRIRADDRVELSNRFFSASEDIDKTKEKIADGEKDLAALKRHWHKNVLAALPLPRLIPVPDNYDMGIARLADLPDDKPKKEEEPVVWKAPEDIPMPIIPHPSTVEIKDRYYHPPSFCKLEKAAKLEDGKVLVRTVKEELFFFLPEEMRIHRRGRPMLSCKINTERTDRGLFLRFHITLHIPAARRSFGGLSKYTPIRIELLNGEVVNLYNIEANTGTFDDETNSVRFEALAPLSVSNAESLRKNDTNKIRLGWTGGHEDYVIYNIGLIRDQLECLDRYLIKN